MAAYCFSMYREITNSVKLAEYRRRVLATVQHSGGRLLGGGRQMRGGGRHLAAGTAGARRISKPRTG